MFDRTLDLFMKFRFSKCWYALIITFIIILGYALSTAKAQSSIKHERIQTIVLYSLGIPLFMIVVLVIGLYVYSGFYSGGIADDIEMKMVVVLALLLVFIPVAYRIAHKRK